MARRHEDRPLSKHTLNLYAGDYDRLVAMYPAKIGAAKTIRDVVHAYVRKIEETAAQRSGRVPLITELDIEVEVNP
jgi:hypothetical protein